MLYVDHECVMYTTWDGLYRIMYGLKSFKWVIRRKSYETSGLVGRKQKGKAIADLRLPRRTLQSL